MLHVHDAKCEKKKQDKMAALSREDARASVLNFFPHVFFLRTNQRDESKYY